MAFVFIFYFFTRKYLNPYKLTMIFGKKGSGKSTLLTKLALKYTKLGVPVYTTEFINLPNVYQIKPKDIGHYNFPRGCVLLIDEVGMVWDNRNYKNIDNNVRDFFKLQRHYHIRVFMFSQSFDVDRKLRDLTDDMYYICSKFRVFSYAKQISKKIVLNNSTADGPSTIAENLQFEPFFLCFLGSRKFTFIPKYVKYFDSFVTPTNNQEFIPNTPCYTKVVKMNKFISPSTCLSLGICAFYDYFLLATSYLEPGLELELEDYPFFTYRLDFKNPLLTIFERFKTIYVFLSPKRQNKKGKIYDK